MKRSYTYQEIKAAWLSCRLDLLESPLPKDWQEIDRLKAVLDFDRAITEFITKLQEQHDEPLEDIDFPHNSLRDEDINYINRRR